MRTPSRLVYLLCAFWISPLGAAPEAIEHDLVTYFDAAEPAEQKAYALGQYLAQRLISLGPVPDHEGLYLGFRDGLNQSNRLETALCQEQIAAWQDLWRTTQQKKSVEQRQERLTLVKQFWDENRQKPNIQTAPSGLQWEVLQAGNGPSPKPQDEVVLHYRALFLDGSEFDSSKRRGRPLHIRVDDTLPGWKEALLRMNPGAHWRLYLLPHLAFAEHGLPPYVPEHALVVTEIELIRIEKSSGFP